LHQKLAAHAPQHGIQGRWRGHSIMFGIVIGMYVVR
jgi:hypothetical protein